MHSIKPLRTVRIESNMSQMELASYADVTQTTISHIENGVHIPQKKTRDKIEKVLGSVDWSRTFDEGLVSS